MYIWLDMYIWSLLQQLTLCLMRACLESVRRAAMIELDKLAQSRLSLPAVVLSLLQLPTQGVEEGEILVSGTCTVHAGRPAWAL